MNRRALVVVVLPTMLWAAYSPAADKRKIPAGYGEVQVTPEVVAPGGRLLVSVPVEADARWRLRAWRLYAYRPYVPKACIAAKQWPLRKSKHGRQWDSLQIRKWTWFPKDRSPKELTFELDTTGWVPGDYGLKVAALFRNGARDHYTSRGFYFSVLPAKRQDEAE